MFKYKHFIIFTFALVAFFSERLIAQPYYMVTRVTNGVQVIAGTNVTVRKINNPDTNTIGSGCVPELGYYWLGYNFANANCGYSFAFYPPVAKLKIPVDAIDSGLFFHVYINGSPYVLTTGNLSTLYCGSTPLLLPNIVSGALTTLGNHNLEGNCMIDIAPPYVIDSVAVFTDIAPVSFITLSGLGVEMHFAKDTLPYLINPFVDTSLCAGDSLYVNYGATANFAFTNTFTVQLSNASGSFSSPVNIGFRTAATGGIIPCKIPAGTTPGTGYRIRIVSSNPSRISGDDGKNILIGNIVPANVTASNNGPLCAGSSLSLSSSSTTNGVSYNWTGPNSFTSAQQNPVITSISTAAGGTYTVTAKYNGCKATATTSVTVKPLPALPSAGSNSPVCIGSDINLTASSSTPGVAYSWTGPQGYSSNLQNPVIAGATAAMSGTYMVSAALNGCTSANASVTVSVVQGPTINIYPSPNDTICDGKQVTFVAVVSNAGSSPQYQWLKNGVAIPGATAAAYPATGAVTGDAYSCRLIPGSGGSCTAPISSNLIPVTVLSYLAPSVTISVSPDSVVWEWLPVTFTATATDAGLTPQYQWKRNGNDIIGATSSIWSTNSLFDNDVISCDVTSTYICPQPPVVNSNAIKMHVVTGIESSTATGTKTHIYPNPTRDILNVEVASNADYTINDLTGRTLLKGILSKGITQINLSALHTGLYIIVVNSDTERINNRFVKTEN